VKGTVLGYDPAAMKGVISADDGARYEFTAAEWKSGGVPAAGAKVDFEASGAQAVGVYASAGAGIDGAEIGRLFMTRPPIAAALVMILGCFLPIFSAGFINLNLFTVMNFAGMAGGTGVLLYLLWAIPILAVVVLWMEFSKRDAGGTPQNLLIASGAVGAGLIILLLILTSLSGGPVPSIGLGAFIVIGGGVLMLLNAFGVVRTFGAPPPA
jgi:hypothetical protein